MGAAIFLSVKSFREPKSGKTESPAPKGSIGKDEAKLLKKMSKNRLKARKKAAKEKEKESD